MKKILSIANIYLILWAVYFTQGTFIAQGSMMSRIILLLYLGISLYFFFVANIKFTNGSYIKALNILLLVFTVYGLLNAIQGNGVNYIKNIYLSLIPTYTFYVLKQRQMINERWVRIAFVVMTGVVLVQYFSYKLFLESTLREAEMATINVGYDILALLPLVYFFREKPFVQYVILGTLSVLLLSTVKRGAIIIGAICIIYFLFNTLKRANKRTRWYIWIFVLIFIIVGIRYVLNFYMNSEFAQLRIENTLEGDSSGRNYIYAKAWDIVVRSDFFHLLFGHGADATIRIMGIMAHNDWLEILVNQGLLGVVIYLFYWKAFYMTYRRYQEKETKPILGTVLFISVITTLISMSYAAMTLPANVALGYCLGKNEENILQTKLLN